MNGAGFRVVALVCSTGGLQALIEVLAALPADLPAAVIALQHHNPAAPSMLAPILARRALLPVSTAADGDPLTPGRVFVPPAGQHLLITTGGTVALIASGDLPPARPSADLLLTSLALSTGPRAIAVVLSGHGSDGATGATAVHHFGGTVIATDRATSTHFSMPAATIGRPAVTDHIVALDTVAGLLTALIITKPAGMLVAEVALRPIDDSDLDALFEQGRDPESVRMAAFTAEDPDDRAAFDVHVAKIRTLPGAITRVITVDGQLAGSIASFVMAGDTEVTYWIDRTFWGQGIAGRALALLLELVPVRPLSARVASDNVGSLKVLRRAGFVVTGTEISFANGRSAEIEETLLRLPGSAG